MNLSELLPLPGERMAILGTTGTGKTVAVRSIVGGMIPTLGDNDLIVIHDPKDTFKSPDPVNTVRFEGLQKMQRAIKNGGLRKIIRYVPSPEEGANAVGLQAPLWQWVYQRGKQGKRTIIVIDEAYAAVSDSGRGGAPLRALWTRGRELGITAIILTQRPAWIPQYFLDQAERFLVYDLPDEEDRKKVSKLSYPPRGKMGSPGYDPGLTVPPPVDFSAWYWYRKERNTPPVLIRFPENPVTLAIADESEK